MRKAKLFLLTLLLSGCMGERSDKLQLDWKVAAVLPGDGQEAHIGLAGPITGLLEDKLLVAGGANFPEGKPWEGGQKVYQKKAYLYAIGADGVLKLEQELPFTDSLAYSANVSVGKDLYSVGGERNGQATSDVFRYNFVDGALQRERMSPLPVPLTNAAAALVDQCIFVVGGENSEAVSDKVYRWDLGAPEAGWAEFVKLGYPVSHAAVAPDGSGNIIIAGGRMRNLNNKSTIYANVKRLNTKNKSLEELSVLPYPLAAGTAVCYNNTLILVGGDDGSTFHQVEEKIAAIQLSKDMAQKAKLTEEKNRILSSHPGFAKTVWAMDLSAKSWYKLDDIKGESPVTTTAILKDKFIIIPSGEIRAGVRTDQILVGTLM